jgi:putative membrane protein
MGTNTGMDGWMGGSLGWGWMLIWPITLIGIPLAFGYCLITRRETSEGRADTAIDVLRLRYAQGEIDEEEFETRRKMLVRGGE